MVLPSHSWLPAPSLTALLVQQLINLKKQKVSQNQQISDCLLHEKQNKPFWIFCFPTWTIFFRLVKRSCRSFAWQKRTWAKARTKVTLIMGSKSQTDNLFPLLLLKTYADALTQCTALKDFLPLKRQAPVSTGLFPPLGSLREVFS